MPLRPPILRAIRPAISEYRIARPTLSWNAAHSLYSRPRNLPGAFVRQFHATTPLHDETPNHYQTLSLEPSAAAPEIKRQFFALSKQYHPDRNPDDPNASTRFVEISEAYHVLSSPEKREKYDRQIGVGRYARGGIATHTGSYSSAGYAGSRAATGLNKKRGTFRGPPPSFYKSGGYGRHGAKRAEYAHHEHPGAASREAGPESYGERGAGFGPGQKGQGNEVPHFDDARHKRTHDNVNEYISARRERQKIERAEEEVAKGNTSVNFAAIMGVLGVIAATTAYFDGKHPERETRKRREG